MIKQFKQTAVIIVAGAVAMTTQTASAHDPIFGIGPHVLFKEGVEAAINLDADKAGSQNGQSASLELRYGITGDWAVGAELPYKFLDDGNDSNDGVGNFSAFTKYRFWREDSLGLQESAAVLLKVVSDSGSKSGTPSIGSGATDTIVGLTYGSEGRKWYKWASARYRFNGRNDAGVERGDKILIDFVGGIRPNLTGYLETDIVWLLELNGEFGKRARFNGSELANTGGTEWFVSPGIFWTQRNFAIKAGVQIPVYSNLNGNQNESDYRAKMTFEWHF